MKKDFKQADFRKELQKIMPGYKWTIHRGKGSMEATGVVSSGFNRMSTLSVVRRMRNDAPEYEVKSAGYGLRAEWLWTARSSTLAQALRALQNHYEWNANNYRSHAEALQRGREPKNEIATSTIRDPEVKVRTTAHEGWVTWNVSQNLTDRWGDINYSNAGNKPLVLLESDSALLVRLRSQMWDGKTFIVRKDGVFGILFEVEFCSKESEEHAKDGDSDWYSKLKPQADVVEALLSGIKTLENNFPGVLFAVPDETQIINDRPAVWAFVPDGLLTDVQRDALGKALLDI